MQVLAATFANEHTARTVEAELRRRYELGPSDIDVAARGTAGAEDSHAVVLAGRFLEDRIGDVRAIVEELGGEIVAVVDERWTKPRSNITQRASSLPRGH
ncbi:MAG: hypothetical protein H0X16_01165 [Chloroflexi bacterium]|nr:hypothetical protein [Chloroflexota bacterium]